MPLIGRQRTVVLEPVVVVESEHAPAIWFDRPRPRAICTGVANPYVGEIAFADAQIGRLLEVLKRRGLLDRTIVVVAGDHGESLGERSERDHGVFIYENVLRVPLMIRAPSLAPFRVGEVVRLTDVMPTVLNLADVPVPQVDGLSLVDLMRGRRHGLGLEAYSESQYPERLGWSPLRALRDGRFKLIDAPRPELYDLGRDPFEQENIYDDHRALADAMTGRAAAIGRGARPKQDGRARVTPELRARLAALGYISSIATPEPARRAGLPDPKDCIGAHVHENDSVQRRSSVSDRQGPRTRPAPSAK